MWVVVAFEEREPSPKQLIVSSAKAKGESERDGLDAARDSIRRLGLRGFFLAPGQDEICYRVPGFSPGYMPIAGVCSDRACFR